jgi:hypothetical protein
VLFCCLLARQPHRKVFIPTWAARQQSHPSSFGTWAAAVAGVANVQIAMVGAQIVSTAA